MVYSPLQAFTVGVQEQDRLLARIKRLGLTARQLELNRYWSFYSATQYEARTVGWDGRRCMSDVERDTVSRNAVLPPGFYDGAGQYDEMPLNMRKPVAPYHLTRAVVDRFTGLLFSAKMHPKISVAGGPDLQSWVESLIKSARLWIRFAYARSFGGGMGSVAMSFRFRNGKPIVDVHDSRWCTPTFIDISTGEISALEIRYMYPVEVRKPDGTPATVDYWYRRCIDTDRDVVYKPMPVGNGEEPTWIAQTDVPHGFGECPAVWIRNTQTDEMDGEPDCQGEFEAQEAIDRLISQADQGAVENADPTLEIDSDELRVEQIKKGSRNAFKLEKGASAKYLEMTGTGVDSALKVADVHRRNFLEVVRCILDFEQGSAQMTATEVERRLAPMHERGDLFREQYGQHGIVPLLGKMIRAVLRMRSAAIGAAPNFDPASGLRLVPRVMPALPEIPPGLAELDDDQIELTWPEWVQRGAQDAQAAATAVSAALTAQALDRESAMQYLAPYFGIDDPAAALKRLTDQAGAADGAMMGDLQAAGAAGRRPPPAPPPPHAPPAAHPPPAIAGGGAAPGQGQGIAGRP